MNYKDLRVNRANLFQQINNFLESIGSGFLCDEIKFINSNLYRAIISNGGFINIYYNKDGTTSLNPLQGKVETHQLNFSICDHIKESCKIHIEESNISFRLVSRELYDKIIEEVRNNVYCVKCDGSSINANDIKWIIEGKQGDKVHLTYYGTGTALLQGRPVVMFSVVLGIIVEKTGLVILDSRMSQKEFLDYADEKFKKIMPNASKFTKDEFKNCIQQAVLDYEFDVYKTDWTSLVFSAIRAIEWQLYIIFDAKSIPVRDHNNRKHFFHFDFDNKKKKYILNTLYAQTCNSKDILTIEKLYGLYKKYRLPFLHAGDFNHGIDQTRTIKSKQDARVLIKEILLEIDKYYV